MRFDNIRFDASNGTETEVCIKFDNERHTFHVLDVYLYGDTSLTTSIDRIQAMILRKVGIYDYPAHVFNWVIYDSLGNIFEFTGEGAFVPIPPETADLYLDFFIISGKRRQQNLGGIDYV
jgi:hypothetical protein